MVLTATIHPQVRAKLPPIAWFINPGDTLTIPSFKQVWTKKAERIRCPPPLPEGSADSLLMRMLVPAPYQAPAKTDKKKKKKEEGTSDAVSGDADAQSSHEGDDDEAEE